jgi:hypothetical protein
MDASRKPHYEEVMNDPTPETTPSLPSMTSLPPWWGRMESLWLWMAPLCSLLFALSLPLSPNDLWYHVRAGEFIARGTIPTQNGMSLAVPLSTPYYYQSWLGELGLYLSLKTAGLSGLMMLRACCLGTTVLLVAAATFRRLLRLPNAPSRLLAARLSALAGTVGFAIASNNVDLRPQTFSVLLFSLWMFGVLEFRAVQGGARTRWGIFLVVLTGLWANTHGAFAVSILGLMALALGDALSRHERARAAISVALASLIIVVINPAGLGLYKYVAQLSNNEIGQRFIQEWKSPGFDEWHSVLFWLCSATLLVWWALRVRSSTKKNQNLGEQMAFALYFVMAARDQRAMIWFALWMAPLLATMLAGRRPYPGHPEAAPPRVAQVFNAVILAFLLLLPMALFPGVKAQWPWPSEFRQRFAPTPAALFPGDPPLLLENTTAVAAAQYLRKSPPRGRLFTDMVCGSYLTWATYPEVRPWCDPRIELFPVAFWEDYIHLSSGPPGAADELVRRGFTDALVDRGNQPGLVKRLQADASWKLVARSGETLLFRHKPT